MYLQVQFKGKNISAPAVVKHTKEAWLAMNIGREFMDKTEEERTALINEMYDKCQVAVADELVRLKKEAGNEAEIVPPAPDENNTSKSKANARRNNAAPPDEDAAANNK